MDLERMLEKCRREQWSVEELDWSGTPRPMSADDERAIVQYFTDMAGVERLAGALFEEQRRRAVDPTLEAIFATFVEDEERHAQAAERLARYYDTRKLQTYEMNKALQRFRPHFVASVKYLSAEIANAYITSGELILDIALLRSINDYVHDTMSERAMNLINRDESRPIALDSPMIGYYSSQAYADKLSAEPRKPLRVQLSALWSFAHVLYYGAPFSRGVFFKPMQVVDPSGVRMKEAFKRIQLLSKKTGVRRSAFVKFMERLQDQYNDSAFTRVVFGRAIERFLGVGPEMIARLYDEAERERASRMSYEELAADALQAKFA